MGDGRSLPAAQYHRLSHESHTVNSSGTLDNSVHTAIAIEIYIYIYMYIYMYIYIYIYLYI